MKKVGSCSESILMHYGTSMLPLTQLLSFEIGQDCNLMIQHKHKCPASLIKRTERILTDDIIINSSIEAYSLGFEGLISWSFYNEPMIHARRILNLMEIIRSKIPQSRFLLWTNGTILIEDQRMGLFEQIFVTNYLSTPADTLAKYFGNIVLFKDNPQLDDRLSCHADPSDEWRKKRCGMPFDNFIISNTGEVYMCCMDWNNDIKIGSIFDSTIKELNEIRNVYIRKISGKVMLEDAPKTCINCAFKWNTHFVDHDIRRKAISQIGSL